MAVIAFSSLEYPEHVYVPLRTYVNSFRKTRLAHCERSIEIIAGYIIVEVGQLVKSA